MFSSNTTQVSDGGYQISRSLRFNSADSTYLNRTPASAGNRRTYTWSGWVKRSSIGTGDRRLFEAGASSSNVFWFGFGNDSSTDQFLIQDYSGGFGIQLATTALYRDPSAWYHVVVAIDTTQATSTDRVKLYLNGVQVTSFSTATYPSQNYDTRTNQTVVHDLGGSTVIGGSAYYNGYITEVNFIDGTQLTPSSFGETNAQTGVWQPKAYSGSYGTNGFYLNFSDNSNTTAATLGKDYSGNGNNWTPNNFSVTAGAGNDSLVDSPTSYGTDTGVGGEVRGNYATLNPLNSSGTLANGNLDESSTTNAWKSNIATIGVTSGKWYWECTAVSNQYYILGVCEQVQATSLTYTNPTTSWTYDGRASKDGNGTNGAYGGYGATYTGGDIIGVALDMDAGTLTFYKNGTSQGVAFNTGLTGKTISPVVATYVVSGSAGWYCNFGQRPFAYTAPSGYKALCTQNLPTPTIGATTATQASKFFKPVIYNGTNQTPQNITTVGFQPDFVWIKWRANTYYHNLFDVIRGVNNVLSTNVANAEGTRAGTLTAFNSDGFSLGNDSTYSGVNIDATSYVAWNWKANGSGSTNTAGSITSTVSANTTSGFSVVTYTGTGANATVGHGLGVAPSMVITKSRSDTGGWAVYHISTGASYYLLLNGTSTAANEPTLWNNTAPTSTRFSIGTSGAANTSAATYVAYCFAPIAGYSAFGSYEGNGSTDGPFVFTGMRPAYVMVKRTDSNGDWRVWDVARETYNVMSAPLYPNDSGTEVSSSNNYIDVLSNGFKLRNATAAINANGGAYIYMAFATSPFKFSLAR